MAGNDSAKGNPATKRMSNPRHKTRCDRGHARTEKRKEKIKLDVALRERENKIATDEGGYTPWQTAKIERFKRRHPEYA